MSLNEDLPIKIQTIILIFLIHSFNSLVSSYLIDVTDVKLIILRIFFRRLILSENKYKEWLNYPFGETYKM